MNVAARGLDGNRLYQINTDEPNVNLKVLGDEEHHKLVNIGSGGLHTLPLKSGWEKLFEI